MINKDTLLFGSFAKEAGNNGCRMFNSAFRHFNIDAAYKSFSVDDIGKAIEAARTLKFTGFALTMPYKIEAMKYLDVIEKTASIIGSVNTVIINNGVLCGYNTDYMAARDILLENKFNMRDKTLYILGTGGYSKAVQYAAKTCGIKYYIINRYNWELLTDIKNSIIYNCTPLKNIVHASNTYIDCLINTEYGKRLSMIQAAYQFKLYMKDRLNATTDEIINSFSKFD